MSLSSTGLTAQDLIYLGVSGLSGRVENYSLQSLVELIYVKEGNKLIAREMGRLDVALQAAQGSLDVLTEIQNLHNKIAVPSSMSFASTFPFRFNLDNQSFVVPRWSITSTIQVPVDYYVGVPLVLIQSYRLSTHVTTVFRDPGVLPPAFVVSGPTNHSFTINGRDSYRSAYNTLASAYYVPIDPVVLGNMSAIFGYMTQMETQKQRLSNFMRSLSGLPSNLRAGAESLRGRLSTVYASLPANSSSAFEKWVLDGNQLHGVAGVEKAGSIQKDINIAISAAQSLNSAQNQDVRKFTFQFQQFMQSAAAILTALNQIFRSMSGNISRT